MARRERLANDAQSTLDGAINDSVTTLDVVSATDFSSDGDFRVRVNDEIILVTGVSTNEFTIERGAEGTSPAAHGSGDAICQVLTELGMRTWIKENSDPRALTARPPYRCADSSGDLLDASDFTTFGTFADSTIFDDGNVISIRQDVKYSANQLAIKGRPVPGSTPYELITCVDCVNGESNNGGIMGICFFDDGGTKIMAYACAGSGDTPDIAVQRMNSETSFNSTLNKTHTLTGSASTKIWMKLEDNGTNVIFSFSNDGVNFEETTSVTRGSFFTDSGFPTHYGFFTQNRDSDTPVMTSLLAWQE